MSTEIQVKNYIFAETGREVHMVGDYVGVCWNLEKHTETEVVNGVTTFKESWHRAVRPFCMTPHIDFVGIREYGYDAGFAEDEDSPVEGGLSVEQAKQIAEELLRAVAYVESLEGK